jgi:hypothetical protein
MIIATWPWLALILLGAWHGLNPGGPQDRFFSALSNLIEPGLRGTGGFR